METFDKKLRHFTDTIERYTGKTGYAMTVNATPGVKANPCDGLRRLDELYTPKQVNRGLDRMLNDMGQGTVSRPPGANGN